MVQTRSELIAKIREQRRLKNEDNPKGLGKMRKPELIDLLDDGHRSDNVVDTVVQTPVVQTPVIQTPVVQTPAEDIKIVKPSTNPPNEIYVDDDDTKESEIDDSLLSIRESKRAIRTKANEFKKIVNGYVRELKRSFKNGSITDEFIQDLIDQHNYQKNLYKYDIEDIIDYTEKELSDDFMSKIDDIFSDTTEKFSDNLE